MRLARFGAVAAGQASPTGSVTTVTSHVTSVPPVVNPRKRERDPDHQGTTLVVGREVKRSRHESPPVQVKIIMKLNACLKSQVQLLQLKGQEPEWPIPKLNVVIV